MQAAAVLAQTQRLGQLEACCALSSGHCVGPPKGSTGNRPGESAEDLYELGWHGICKTQANDGCRDMTDAPQWMHIQPLDPRQCTEQSRYSEGEHQGARSASPVISEKHLYTAVVELNPQRIQRQVHLTIHLFPRH